MVGCTQPKTTLHFFERTIILHTGLFVTEGIKYILHRYNNSVTEQMRQAARLEFKPQARKETRQGSCVLVKVLPKCCCSWRLIKGKRPSTEEDSAVHAVPNKHSSCMISCMLAASPSLDKRQCNYTEMIAWPRAAEAASISFTSPSSHELNRRVRLPDPRRHACI